MSDEGAIVDRLEAAETAYTEATAAVEAIEGAEVSAVPEHLRRFESVLDAYEERATGSGDFEGYLEFRGQVTSFVAALPDDLAARPAFEAAADALDQRRLRSRHFEDARTALDPAREIVDTLEQQRTAAAELRAARDAAEQRISDLNDRIARLEHVASFADVPVEDSVAPIRQPVTAYNEAVADAFRAFYRETPAVDVLDVLALADRYPLIEMRAPPPRLLAALQEGVGGELTIPELLEYASYSRSKLRHYVDDPAALTRAVAEHERYLEAVSAEPFRVAWPPPPAAVARWELRELESVIARFADRQAMLAVRELRSLVRDGDRFDALRRVALARRQLDETERRRLARGEVESALEEAWTTRQRIQSALNSVAVPSAV